jgi:phage terminase Nu1 subunit (DNA packaging protein)
MRASTQSQRAQQPKCEPAEGVALNWDGLLTRKGVAARCQVDVRTVDRWQAEGVVPFIKVGEVVRFHWPTTVAYLLAHFTVLNNGEEEGAKAESRKQKTEMKLAALCRDAATTRKNL